MSHDLAYLSSPPISTRSLQEALDRPAVLERRPSRLLLGEVGIMASHYAAGVREHIDAFEARYVLTISLAGGGHVTQAGHTAPLIPGRRAALTSPSMAAEIELRSGYSGLDVVVPAQVMENALAALTRAPRTTPLRFEPAVDIGSGPGAAIVRLLEFILAEAERDGVPRVHPVVASGMADTLVNALLLGVPHTHSELLSRASAEEREPQCIRVAEEYIAANAHRHISVADLAAVAGVSVRTLFAATRAHRGQSPLTFLRTQRLELARTRLLSGASTTVAEIARSCGFEHLGRFNLGYRKRFGETPARTLRRVRAKQR